MYLNFLLKATVLSLTRLISTYDVFKYCHAVIFIVVVFSLISTYDVFKSTSNLSLIISKAV